MATKLNHDTRLDNLVGGQYRIWRDGQNIMIPKGMSTTHPLSTELVEANTRVSGVINHGYFNKPLAEFTDANVDIEEYDQYYLQTWRNSDNIPINNPNIDFHFDIGLNQLYISTHITFECNGYYGDFLGEIPLHFKDGTINTWTSDNLTFQNYNLQEVFGEFFIIANPTEYEINNGILFNTQYALQKDNLPISIIVRRANINNGNSQMPLLLHNIDFFNLNLYTMTFKLLGGE